MKSKCYNRKPAMWVKNIINLIKEATYSLRNEVSMRKWNKEYHKLKLNQKVALSKYIPIMIWIYPNRKTEPPPPPPPPLLYMERNKNTEQLSEELTDLILQQDEKE